MTISCDQCGGACCKVLNIDMSKMDPDKRRHVSMRGVVSGDRVYLPCPCSCLVDGRCTIYHDSIIRPDLCHQYVVGGPECLRVREAAGILPGSVKCANCDELGMPEDMKVKGEKGEFLICAPCEALCNKKAAEAVREAAGL